MQRARDSEAQRERAVLRIQSAVRALLLRPLSRISSRRQTRSTSSWRWPTQKEATAVGSIQSTMAGISGEPAVAAKRAELQHLRREQATYAGGQPVARPLRNPGRSLGSDTPAPATSSQARPPVQSKPQDTSRARRMPPWAPPATRRPREAAAARQTGAKQGGASCGNCGVVEECAMSVPPSASFGVRDFDSLDACPGPTVEVPEQSAAAACATTRQPLPYAQVGRSAEVKCRQRPLRSDPEGSSSVSRARFILVGVGDDHSAGT